MGANAYQYDVKLNLSADTKLAQSQIEVLQKQLKSVSDLKLNFSGVNQLTDEINEASVAAMKLQANLQSALNPDTKNLDFSKFNNSIVRSGDSIEGLAQSLLKAGSKGSSAFVQLADSIARSEVPLMRTNKLVNGLWDNLKKTAGWQISSSVIHGVMGQYQQAMGYAKALDKSLNDIRIVTGQSADQMARFAKEANAAAKQLSTTTTDYTNASLIYYQQGLSDAEVKKRSDITIKMANATGTSAQKVSDQLTSIWNNFADGTKSLEHYADVMTALGAATASSTDEIAKGIQKFAAIGDTVGLSYEYAASALATITATTRESADTVGNSLKTLFSRIQGLQLGDTLDDGTTLNKYSTALAKVGISIKDASGNLKDMNSILDDMGAKWHTLAEDQQMALAQTVGGARQYTQIMTLMENWDFFKENLNVANTATGSLQMQADIYADSWEAASQRMRASLEGMYDNLIESESFKKILNMGATIVDGISGAISGVGGLGGVLATVGSIFGSVFKTQISSSISDAFYTVGQMIPAIRKKTLQYQDQTLERMIASISDPGATPGLGDSERAALKTITERTYKDRKDLSQIRSRMTEEQKNLDVDLEQKILDLDTKELDLARQADEGRKLYAEGVEAVSNDPNLFKSSQLTFGPADLVELGISQNNVNLAQAMLTSGSGESLSLAKLFQNIGESQANAFTEVDKIGSHLIDNDPNYDRPQSEEDVRKLFGNLLGISSKEFDRISDSRIKDDDLTSREKVLRQELAERTKAYGDWYDETIEAGILPTAHTKDTFKEVFVQYFTNQIDEIENGIIEGLGVSAEDGSVRTAVDAMIGGARESKIADNQREGIGAARNTYIQERDRNREQASHSLSQGITSGITGLLSMSGAMQALEGSISNFREGNIGSGLFGAATGLFDFAHSSKEYQEAFTQLGIAGKSRAEKAAQEAEKYKLRQQQSDLQETVKEGEAAKYDEEIKKQEQALREFVGQKGKANETWDHFTTKDQKKLNNLEKLKEEGTNLDDKQQAQYAYLKRKQEMTLDLESLKAGQSEFEDNKSKLHDISEELNKLADVGEGSRFSGAFSKLGGIFEKLSTHADGLTASFQAVQFAVSATTKINDYLYNENLRHAQETQNVANELNTAYASSQNNYNALLAGIEEYNTQTVKLTESNLSGAAKSAAIYDQNQAALNLIDKYNITDFSRIGDTIKINENALEEAKEASIQSMATAKYAAGLASVDAKVKQNEYSEEQLERDLVHDERGQQIAGTIGAAGTAALVGFLIGGPIGAAIGGLAGAAIGGINALAADYIGETARENSYVDKAIAKTRETGSTSWMDKETVDGFTASELKKLRDSRSDIKQLAASEEAAEQMDITQRESIAKDLVSNNDRTEDFKYADRLVDGLANAAEGWEELGKNYDALFVTSQQRIDAAQKINSELGLSGPVTWEDDKKNKMMTYTTADGQTGMISYETLSRLEGTKKGKAGADSYINQMMEAYDVIKEDADEQTAAGVLSFLSSGNFDNATFGETDKAQQYLADAVKNYGEGNYDAVAASLGLDFTSGQGLAALEAYAKEQGYTTTTYDDYGNAVIEGDFQKYIDNVLQGSASYASGARTNLDALLDGKLSQFGGQDFKNSDIYGSMSNATAQDFYSQLNYISSTQGEAAAQTYLSSLSGILEDADPEDYGQIMSSLMALDASDWSIDTSIIDIMEEYGVTIDNTNGSLQQFVDTMRLTAGSISGLEDKMSSLIDVAGALEGLELGKSVSDDVLQKLKDQGINFDEETFSTWTGDNVLIENTDAAKASIQDKLADTYNAYDDAVDAVEESSMFDGLSEAEKTEKLRELSKLSQADFEDKLQYHNENYDMDMGVFVRQVLSDQERTALNTNIEAKNQLEKELEGFKWDETAKQYVRDDGTVMDVNTYNQKTSELNGYNDAIALSFNKVKDAISAAKDPVEMKKLSEQYVSLFDSYEEAMSDGLTQDMIAEGYLEAGDALAYYASKYPDLIDDIEAYNHAMEYGTEEQKKNAEAQLETSVAIRDAMAGYEKITGQKVKLKEFEAAMQKVEEQVSESLKDGVGYDLSDGQLAEIAEEAMITSNAYHTLKNNYSTWLSTYKQGGDTVAKLSASGEALTKLATNIKNFLGLSDLKTSDSILEGVIKDYIDKGGDIGKLLTDRAARINLRKDIILASNLSLSNKLNERGSGPDGYTESAYELRKAIDALTDIATSSEYGEGIFGSGELSEADQGKVKKANDELLANTDNWEEYQAAVEASGGHAVNSFSIARENTSGEGGKYTVSNYTYVQKEGGGGAYIDQNGNEYDGTANLSFGEAGADGKFRTGGGGGGGGGGPTKVQVKSAQELMTRYKVIDQKTTINDMQKTAALQAKDLLYGQSKINQLNTINKLLQKQQQLTTDRITEELDYLEKDKKKIEELIERYNKDAKDEDKINLEFDGFGIITNYKQVIGKWAEELAALYADGELTAEEGKKAEDLQKKIQDFNTVIKDYEDSLNQLMTSIEQYEQTLYERFNNQMEILTYKVQYKIELEQDDISYIDFYTSSIKDSYSMMYKYLELIGSKNQELLSEMAIYQQGYYDLLGYMTDDPLQLWATQGVEGILTADQIEAARSYRDGMIETYNAAVATREEIEDQVLRVFDKWNEKIEKNINGISRFTDILSQFKDIINIVGKEAFGLSDTFMKTFEQQSINQSMDNIAASKSHYEDLSKTYDNAQTYLSNAQEKYATVYAQWEAAKAAGDKEGAKALEGVVATAEQDVEYWESIADKTQEEMESAETAMLTTLQHTLTMISEQFTNAITQAVDDFNESIYKFNGLDGLVSDYEMIREQQDLMVEDYEKIYNLNKLNRNLEKTLDNSKLTAGRAKLLEIQKEINDLNKSNVELSKYDLDYLQAKYDLKVAEMELENARNAKDTVMLSKDSEGNWSYIYSQNANVVEEAEQKVEDALFKMQQLSAQYTEEMSQAMMSISQQMRDEISAVSIQDFESAEAYYAEIERIQAKYSEQLAHREAELNKSIANNADLYNQDWANYSEATGYKISADQEWVDSFSETTLGSLVGSTSDISDYTTLIADSTNKMNESLGAAASTYFVNADKALKTYGSSLKTFGSTVSSTTSNIITQSEKAVKEVSEMGTTLVGEFQTITETVSKDLEKWATDIGNTLTNLLDQIKNINQMIADSASKAIPETDEMIGQEEAVARLNSATFNNSSYVGWTFDGTRAIHNGVDIVAFNGQLVKDVNAALQKYADTPTTNPEAREAAAAELRKVIQDYWTFKRILEKIYDPTNIKIEEVETPDITEMSSGGYTGEWGNEGKYAVLHEKELVLNKDDTSNFLEALNVSRSLIEMIEMNARASSFGLGDMHAATIQDSLQNFEQQVTITAEFPDATDHSEIEQAFDNLINMASQYAHRYK